MKHSNIADAAKLTTVQDDLAEIDLPTLVSSGEPQAATVSERLPVKRRHATRDALLAAMFFLVLAALTTWPRLSSSATSVVDYGDPLIDIWRLRWISQTLFTDPAQLFAAPIFYGYPSPLAYDDIVIGPALLAFLLTPLTRSIELTYNLLIVASFALTGWCAFLLARHITKSASAGVVAGITFGFWSYTFAHISHLTSLSLYPIPLALLCLHRFFEVSGRRNMELASNKQHIPATNKVSRNGFKTWLALWWAVGFTACFIWQLLHSFYYAAYLGMAAGAWLLWELLVIRRWRVWTARDRIRTIALLGAIGITAGGVLFVISAPYRQVQQQLGFYRASNEQATWSAQLTDYVSVSPRNQTYADLLPTTFPEPLFPGFAALVLGFVGVTGLVIALIRRTDGASGRDERLTSIFYMLLAASAVILSLGPVGSVGDLRLPLPYQILGSLPGFNGLRAPGRLAVLAALGWGVMAAWGWWYVARLGSATARKLSWSGALTSQRGVTITGTSALLLLAGLMIREQWTVPTPSVALPPTRELSLMPGVVPPAYEWLATQEEKGVLAELPILVGLQKPTVTYTRMYYQGVHRHPLMNGHSSFIPPTYPEIALMLDDPLEVTPTDVGILQSLDVKYLMFYRPSYKKKHWQQIKDSVSAFPELSEVGEFGEDTLFTVAPLDDNARPRLGWSAPPQMAASATVPITVTLTNVYKYPLLSRLHLRMPLNVHWQYMGSGQETGEALPTPQPDLPPSDSTIYVETPLMLNEGAQRFAALITAPSKPGKYSLHLRTTWSVPHYQHGDGATVEVRP